MHIPHRTSIPPRAPQLAGCASTRPAAQDAGRRPGRPASDRASRARSLAAVAALAAALALMAAPAGSAAAAPATTPVCRPVAVPVTAGLVGGASIHGTLCTPPDPDGDLQILVSGATYNSWYWSGEGDPAYSYVAAANQAGTTTFAIDPLGTGASTKPLSALLTGAVQASAIHQVIHAARAGRLDGLAYQRVLLVGHSLGSLDSILTASTYAGDVDGVVLTGFTHYLSVAGLTDAFVGSLRPADLEGFGPSVDPLYLTTVPGTREALFDAADDVDPAVVRGDELHRDVVATAEIPDTLLLGLAPASSRAISVPVLEVDGTQDLIFCGPLTPGCSTAADLDAHEAGDFTRLATYVLPGAGHDVTLAANAAIADQVIQQWTASLRAGRVLTGPMGE